MATRSDGVGATPGRDRAGEAGIAQRVQCWHRRAGLAAGVVLALLAVTGLALNHTDALDLDSRPVRASWVLAHYGRLPDLPATAFRDAGQVVVAAGGRVFVDGRPLPVSADALVGVVGLDGGQRLLATADTLVVVDAHGTVVERIGDAEGLPGRVVALGRGADGAPVVATTAGDYALDPGRLLWGPAAAPVHWSRPEPLPPAAREALRHALAGDGVSLERVLLDMHSGRWFGPAGVLVVDLVGLACLLLAATGVWMWWRTRRQQGRR